MHPRVEKNWSSSIELHVWQVLDCYAREWCCLCTTITLHKIYSRWRNKADAVSILWSVDSLRDERCAICFLVIYSIYLFICDVMCLYITMMIISWFGTVRFCLYSKKRRLSLCNLCVWWIASKAHTSTYRELMLVFAEAYNLIPAV